MFVETAFVRPSAPRTQRTISEHETRCVFCRASLVSPVLETHGPLPRPPPARTFRAVLWLWPETFVNDFVSFLLVIFKCSNTLAHRLAEAKVCHCNRQSSNLSSLLHLSWLRSVPTRVTRPSWVSRGSAPRCLSARIKTKTLPGTGHLPSWQRGMVADHTWS